MKVKKNSKWVLANEWANFKEGKLQAEDIYCEKKIYVLRLCNAVRTPWISSIRLTYHDAGVSSVDIERMETLLTHLKAGAQKKMVCGPEKDTHCNRYELWRRAWSDASLCVLC